MIEVKKITTQQFGEIEVEPEFIFNFENGLLGFEHLREFVLITDDETAPFKWLISIEEPLIGFPLLSPWHIDLSYNPGKDIDLEIEVILVVVTLEDEKGRLTANMKAPVILNIDEQSGRQIILPSDKYSPTFIISRKREWK